MFSYPIELIADDNDSVNPFASAQCLLDRLKIAGFTEVDGLDLCPPGRQPDDGHCGRQERGEPGNKALQNVSEASA